MYHLNILIDICWKFSDLLQGTQTMHPIVLWTFGSQSSQTVMPVKMDMSKYCLQCHKCVYLGKQREKWPTWCQAWPFYGKPQQPPCAQHLYFRFSYLFTLKHHDYNSGFVALDEVFAYLSEFPVHLFQILCGLHCIPLVSFVPLQSTSVKSHHPPIQLCLCGSRKKGKGDCW